jgi:hypothetical protein
MIQTETIPTGTAAAAAMPAAESLSHKPAGVAAGTAERVTVGEIAHGLGHRSFGALMLAFAFPNMLPLPPGASAVLGAPLIVLSAQLMLGRDAWLPGPIARRSLRRADFAALVARATPWLERAEQLLRPRLPLFAGRAAEPVIGLLLVVLSVLLALPIPFGNFLPALAICLFALGILERDGALVLAGCVASVAAAAKVGVLAWGMAQAAVFAADRLLQ